MAGKRKIIWTVSCPVYPLRVTLDEGAWAHAVDGHAEVAPYQDAARNAVETPSAVYQSKTQPDSVLFFNHNVTNNQGLVLTVPVLVHGYEGIVTTINFRPPGYTGQVIWKE